MDTHKEIKPWSLVKITQGPDVPLFDMKVKTMRNPRNETVIDAIVLNAADTVNVVAIDQDGALIIVEQYRFGIDSISFELPAGVIDGTEEPVYAAQRELREETGYSSDTWTYLGRSFVNPAYVDNCCHHFLATDCKKTHEVNQDDLEDIKVHLVEKLVIPAFMTKHIVRDAIGKTALHLVFPQESPLT